MKKRIALILLVCMVLAAVPAMAEEEYRGKMEVVNCSEWVSMRETPDTGSPRLVKVSLGSIVSDCRRIDDEWVYGYFDGYGGYILAQYLEPSDGRNTFSAMMVTITGDGAPVYATLDGEEAYDFIPASTIVRNCRIMDNGRIYVEWGSRCGFIRLEHAEVYTEMMHYPHQITLHCNLFGDSSTGVSQAEALPPALLVADAGHFPLGDEYNEYVQADTDAPMAKFVLYTDRELNTIHLFSVSLRSMDRMTGEAVLDLAVENILYQMDPRHPLCVSAVLDGAVPNLAVGYEESPGVYRFAFIQISGEDGSLYLSEF